MFDFTTLPIPLFTFLLAYGDALFPLNFFIFGEPAFLLAGFELGAGRGWNLVLLIYMGAILGDQSSYFIGRYFGPSILKRIKHPKRRRFIARGRLMLQKHGAKFVFTSRFLGPVSKVTQVMAGAYKLNYWRYSLASISSIFIALAQFIAVGYLSALGFELLNMTELWQMLKTFITENIFITSAAILVLSTSLYMLQKFIRQKLTASRA